LINTQLNCEEKASKTVMNIKQKEKKEKNENLLLRITGKKELQIKNN